MQPNEMSERARKNGRNGVNGAAGNHSVSELVLSPPAGAGGTATIALEHRPRYTDGWRAGKPAEDPEKLKKWGLISARPSEFLLRMRGGTVVQAGQGASCFKWPWESVAVVPTTIQRLHFTADQVTSEKVGVQVTGLAVYRIADPLIAFKMLNFSFAERASEKLEMMLVEMFVGAVRRLVANLSVEQCLTKRKEGLASELMREIAPVVSGVGRPEDRASKGWGVVIDTIEIQDVRVLSQAVFANMQARFRQEQEQKAREAELQKERAVKLGEAEAQRQIELAKVATEKEVRQERQTAEEQAALAKLAAEARVAEARLLAEVEARQRKAEAEERAKMEALAAERRLMQARAEAEAARQAAEEKAKLEAVAAQARLEQARIQSGIDKARLEAEAMLARHEAELAAARHQADVARAQAEVAAAHRERAEAELQIVELEQRKAWLAHETELARARAAKDIENSVSPEVIQLHLANQLPHIAAAFQQKMGEVHVTAIDGANPFGYIAAAVEGVMGIARSAGLKVPGGGNGAAPPPPASPPPAPAPAPARRS
jgi:regulator of protease activity HflC (stomatin/prohibitin superfamily)